MIKVGIVGAGTMGRVHAEAYKKMNDVQLVGVADTSSEAASNLALKADTSFYTSLADLIEAEDPDVIDVCLPTYLHRQAVEFCAARKKHVICEKPIALSLEDAKAMIHACESAGVRLCVGHVLRFFPEYKKAYDLVKSEAVGVVGTARAFRGGGFPNGRQDWFASVDKSGGPIVDLMIHDFDFLRWCFGDVKRAFAKSLLGRNLSRSDHAIVSLRFANGVIAHVEGTWAYPAGFMTELEIAGDKGIIQHSSEEATPIKSYFHATASKGPVTAVPESPLSVSPYQAELEHFLDCIITGKKPIVSAEDAYQALRISLAAQKSAQTGSPVDLEGK